MAATMTKEEAALAAASDLPPREAKALVADALRADDRDLAPTRACRCDQPLEFEWHHCSRCGHDLREVFS